MAQSIALRRPCSATFRMGIESSKPHVSITSAAGFQFVAPEIARDTVSAAARLIRHSTLVPSGCAAITQYDKPALDAYSSSLAYVVEYMS